MKKKLPLQTDNVLKSYSYHAYISSILLENHSDDSPNVSFTDLNVIPYDQHVEWFQSPVSEMCTQQDVLEPFAIQEWNTALCHAGDITGLRDSFNYVHTNISNLDGLEVKIDHIKKTSVWSKAGLMIRESLEPDARYIFLFVTPSVNGVVIQIRDSKGATTTHELVIKLNPPLWIKIVRNGENINLFCGKEKKNWSFTRKVLFDLSSDYYMGLALCSPEHDAFLNWYSSNYIQLSSYKDFTKYQLPFDFNVGLHKDRQFFAFCPYLRTQFLWYSLVEQLERNHIDLVELIISFVDDGNYVDVELDEFFVPDRRAFNKSNYIHTNLIYGYDRSTTTFDLVGYADGNVFRSSKLPFSNFRDAFIRKKESNVILLRMHDFYNFKLNAHIIKQQLQAHLSSFNYFASLSANLNCEPEIVYGLNAYDSFIENFPTRQRDIRPLHVIYEHKKLMIMRLKHLHRNRLLNEDVYETLLEGYRKLEDIALISRNLQLKNAIRNNPKNVDSIIRNIQTIKLEESRLLPLFIENIHSSDHS